MSLLAQKYYCYGSMNYSRSLLIQLFITEVSMYRYSANIWNIPEIKDSVCDFFPARKYKMLSLYIQITTNLILSQTRILNTFTLVQ